mgnify:CR=1 FL=1
MNEKSWLRIYKDFLYMMDQELELLFFSKGVACIVHGVAIQRILAQVQQKYIKEREKGNLWTRYVITRNI